MSEQNKQVSLRYHELDLDDIDDILAPDFVGRHDRLGSDWNREQHRTMWSTHRDIVDIVHEQIAEGDWVATRFTRTGTYKGKQIDLDVMHFKRFEEGKIAEIWEYWNPKQLEQ